MLLTLNWLVFNSSYDFVEDICSNALSQALSFLLFKHSLFVFKHLDLKIVRHILFSDEVVDFLHFLVNVSFNTFNFEFFILFFI